MAEKRSAWAGSDLDFLRASILAVVVPQGLIRFLTSFNIKSGGPSTSNSLKKLQESAMEIIFLK